MIGSDRQRRVGVARRGVGWVCAWVGLVVIAGGSSVWGGGGRAVAADADLIRRREPPAAEKDAAEDPLAGFNTNELRVARDQIVAGGPGKDGIPALSRPRTVQVADADFLGDDERVVGVTVNGQSRAYPIAVLTWHEVVNDELGFDGSGGVVPIAVIYDPLCDAVSVIDRRAGGVVYEFGVSGLLLNSNVLLYDRVDDALWSQVGMAAISGPNAGWALRHLAGWEVAGFGAWKREHPRSTVVSFETGYARDYGKNPYAKYLRDDRVPFPVGHTDRRLANREPVIGVRLGPEARAYPVRVLAARAGGVFQDLIGGRVVRLHADADGSVRVVDAPAEVQVVHTCWFAWAAFYPRTELYNGGGR